VLISTSAKISDSRQGDWNHKGLYLQSEPA